MVRRIFRLWRLYATMDLIWITRDLKQALILNVSDAITNLARMTAVLLLAERFAGIGRWSQLQVIFMLGYGTLVDGLLEMFCSYNVSHISRRVGRGQMDHTLIQPQPVWMALLTEGFMPFSAFGIVITGLGLVGWAASRLGLALSAGWWALLALHVAASWAVMLSFSFLWGSLAFWAPRAAEEISSSAVQLMVQLKGFPLDGLAPALLGGLVTFLPVGFVAWYPSRVLLGLDPSPWAVGITPLAALVASALAGWLFSRGMKHYGRTGSQRYSAFGHRS